MEAGLAVGIVAPSGMITDDSAAQWDDPSDPKADRIGFPATASRPAVPCSLGGAD